VLNVLLEMCAGIICANGGMCDRGECICPPSCPILDVPICANDSVTYQNICSMRSAACNAGVELRAMYPGECHDVTHVTQGTSGLTTELFLLLVVSRDLSFTLSDDLRCDG